MYGTVVQYRIEKDDGFILWAAVTLNREGLRFTTETRVMDVPKVVKWTFSD